MALYIVVIWLLLGQFPLVRLMSCPSMCTCRYKGGKESAVCSDERLIKVPVGLSRGTQVLDISKNNFRQLVKEEFFLLGLINLQKLYIAECKIRKIDDGAFRHLANLVELNLEGNLLIAVPSETFDDYPELRKLILNNNPIRRIETLAFVKLPNLSELELSNCFVDYVGPRAFSGLEALQDLRLDGNRLNTLPSEVGFPIRSLRNLQVYDNPWLCDCYLRIFRNWLVEDMLPVSTPPVCAEPTRLHGRSISQVPSDEFACPPQISAYQIYSVEAFNGDGVKLICSIHSDPPPDIRWMFQGKQLSNYTSIQGRGSPVYSIHQRGEVNRMSVLTIISTTFDDSGEYLCSAENLAGQVIVNISLEVKEKTAEASSLSSGHIAGISIGLVMISVVTVVFICILLSKMRRQSQQSEERKHLELVDKKQSVQLVNHAANDTKYNNEVNKESKQRLPITPNNEHNSLLKKPLMSNAVYTSGGGVSVHRNTSPSSQEMLRLEDCIGGLLPRSSSRMSSSKPDVVNFTCSNSNTNHQEGDNHSPIKHSNSSSKISPVIENIKDSIRSMTTSTSKESSLLLSCNRSDSRERLCEYVQLYEEVEQQKVGSSTPTSEGQSAAIVNNDGTDGSETRTTTPKSDVAKSLKNNGVRNLTNHKQRYGPLGNACGGILKHVNLHGRNYVPVLPPLPVHHFAQVRDSPDEGYEDEVEEEMDT